MSFALNCPKLLSMRQNRDFTSSLSVSCKIAQSAAVFSTPKAELRQNARL